MKIFLISILTAFAFAAEMDEGVLVLTDVNFEEELAKNQNLMVEFYAPWCGHCKKLAPKYAAAAKQLADLDPPQYLAKVDATVQKKLAGKFEIKGYPKLMFFKNGEPHDYAGKRETKALVDYVLKQTQPPSVEVNCESLKKHVKGNKYVMAFFGSTDDALYKDAHVPFATVHPKIKFYHNTDADCASSYGVSQTPGIIFYRKFDSEENTYTGDSTHKALEDWVSPLMIPKYFEWSEDEYDIMFKKDQMTLVMFRDDNDQNDEFMKTFEKSAYANEGKALFSYSGIIENQKAAKMLGAVEDKLPMLIAFEQTNSARNRYMFPTKTQDLTVELITAFIDDIKADKIEKYFMSEDIPASNDGPVKVVVAQEFEKIVKDTSKDVLIMFYAPWCGHCKKLMPVWEELAKEMASNSDIVMAKFDATLNEVDGVQVKGYPTLKFYSKDNKSGEDVKSGRNLPELKKYLEENASSLKTEKSVQHDEL